MVELPPSSFNINGLNVVPRIKTIGFWGIKFMETVGESVDITADLTNISEQSNTYDVYCKMDGHVKGSRQITLNSKETRGVAFTINDNERGQHIVQIGSLSGEFETKAWINWWLIIGLIVALIVLVWLAWYYLYHRPRRNKPTPEENSQPA